ncbi:hypothetical protein GJAV_G00099970 [Gymnothorax javanicus]|nr:hypothetical protein GJAV_G00099970 [Gymnothorax javanicus]
MSEENLEERTVEVSGIPDTFQDDLLALYFENKRSGGGPLVSFNRRGSNAVLLYEEAEVAARVLTKEPHVLQGAVLRTRRKASKDPGKLLLHGVKPSTSLDLLELYVENVTGMREGDYTLYFSQGNDFAVIHFRIPITREEMHGLTAKISAKLLDGASIHPEQIDQTNIILVENLAPGITEDKLTLYFKSRRGGGGEVNEVNMISDGRAKVTFADFETVERVLKQAHKLQECNLSIQPCYEFMEINTNPQSLGSEKGIGVISNNFEQMPTSSRSMEESPPIAMDTSVSEIPPASVKTIDGARAGAALEPGAEMVDPSKDNTQHVLPSTSFSGLISLPDPMKLSLFKSSLFFQDLQKSHPCFDVRITDSTVEIAGPCQLGVEQLKSQILEYFSQIAQARLTVDEETARLLVRNEVQDRLMEHLKLQNLPCSYTVSDCMVTITSSLKLVKEASELIKSLVCEFDIPVIPKYECMLYSQEFVGFLDTLGFCSVTNQGNKIKVVTLAGMENEKQERIVEFLSTPIQVETVITMEPGMLKYIQIHCHQLLADMEQVSIFPLESKDVTGFRLHGNATACHFGEEILQSLVNSVLTRTITVNQPGVARFLVETEGASILAEMQAKFQVFISMDKVHWEPLEDQDIFELAWKLTSEQNFKRTPSDSFRDSVNPRILTVNRTDINSNDVRGADRELIEEAKRLISVVDPKRDLDGEDLYTAPEPMAHSLSPDQVSDSAMSAEEAPRPAPEGQDEGLQVEDEALAGAKRLSLEAVVTPTDLEEDAMLSLAIQYSMEHDNSFAADADDELQKALEMSRKEMELSGPSDSQLQRAIHMSLQDAIKAANSAEIRVFASYNHDLIRVDIALGKKVSLRQCQEKVEHKHLKCLSEHQKRCVDLIRRKHAVEVNIQGTTATVSGFKDYVSEAVTDLKKLLNKIANMESDSEILRKVQWVWHDSNSVPVPYPPNATVFIENVWKMRQKKINIVFDDKPYSIDLEKMEEYDISSGKSVRIERKILLSEDSYMDVQDEDFSLLSNMPEAAKVDVESDEFQDVVREFYETIHEYHNKIKIIQVDKLTNALLFNQYKLKRASMLQSCTERKVERTLYHGTSETSVKEICVHGFNRSFCGKNATVYGQGVYFAVNSSVSVSDQYSPPNADGYKYVFVTKVLTGDFTRDKNCVRWNGRNDELDLEIVKSGTHFKRGRDRSYEIVVPRLPASKCTSSELRRMYAVYRQAHSPTAIEFSVYCNFISSEEKNLVVAGTSQLYVYRIIHDVESASKTEKPSDVKSRKEKLEQVAAFSLFGNVMSMASVQLVGASRDALLLSFKDAKLSVVEYDPGTHDLKTISLHYFEEPELRDGFVQNVHIPIVRVDPENRCAVMLVYGTQLVVLPFRKDTLTDEQEGIVGEGQKSSFLPSYIIDVRELDEKLLNIIDMKFLHGYYEPTLLILYEPNQTWPGRVAVRQDTCSIVAISLNIMQKVHPVIWSLSNLPFDCTQVMAVPRPIGGVVVFSVNSLLYLNQSVPPYGVSLNSQTNGTTAFPLKVQEEVKITLDCSQAAFIASDKMVISLKGGEIYVLTLITDGMRSVRSFHFDKAAASVLTTCMMTMEPGYLFLGSQGKEKERQEEPPNKKKRVDSSANWTAGKATLLDEVDEIEVYGSEAQSGTQLATYSFEVCDSILNIGPCANASMGEPAFLSEEFQSNPEPDLEVVVCSGYGKNGALSVLQRSIRPQVVTTFELPGCHDMWTVISSEKKEQLVPEVKGDAPEEPVPKPAPEEDKNKHGFLILSREDSTMILQTGQEIMELDTSGFATQGPTVFAGNIGDNKYIIQVSPMGIRLLEGVTQLHFIPVDLGSPVVQCAVADPYVIIMTAEGVVSMFVLKTDTYMGKTHRLALQKPQLHTQSRVITLCAYRDVSGMFTTENKVASSAKEETMTRSQTETETIIQDISNTVDDEEEMLYGDSNPLFSPTKEEPSGSASVSQPGTEQGSSKTEPTHWAMVVRENGVMEIYQLPDWRLVFLVKNFPVGQRVLVDSSSGQSAAQGEGKREEVTRQGEIPLVKEVALVALGHRKSRPYLLAHVDQELLIYEAFPYDQQTQSNLKVRFKKLPHNINFREKKLKTSKKDKKSEGGAGEDSSGFKGRVARFRYFEDISGYSGVFICGPSPHWMLVTARGAMRLHPMTIDGPIESFSPFHNINCPKGFLYFNKQGELRISVMPTYLSYDAPWPVRKIPLRCTVHYVTYHVESKVYAVCSSIKEPCTRIPRMTGEEKEFEIIDRDERYINPQQEKFSVQLISPVSWEAIPNTRVDLEEWEHVTCMKTVALKSQETVSGLKGYVALGTCLMQGEEVTCRGRILILDVIEVVPEPGQPLTKNKFKVLYEKEQKGPVTALCHCSGYLVSAIGQKIFLWSLKDNDLTGMAFIDTQLYIHQMFSIKNFILAADVMKSISLLRYQEESKTLSLVSRDAKPLEVYSIEFMVDNNQLGFLVSDRDKNLLVYMYLPEAKESFGGMRLLRRADFNVGANVNTFWRMPCRGALEPGSKKALTWDNKHITWFATLDGGIGLLLPMQEKTYRRLLMLQNALTTVLPHHAGLNPKAFRMLHADRRTLQNAVRNILDGELLNKYLYLSTMERSELAKKIGTTSDIILDDLLEIDRVTAHF